MTKHKIFNSSETFLAPHGRAELRTEREIFCELVTKWGKYPDVAWEMAVKMVDERKKMDIH